MADAFSSGFATGQKAYEGFMSRQEKEKDRKASARLGESRDRYYDAQAEQIRGSSEEREEETKRGAGMLSAKRAILRQEGESDKDLKARKKEYTTKNPLAGTRNRAARSKSRTQGLENKKIKEAARQARMQNDEFEKVAHLKSPQQRAREIEAGVRQKEVTVESTQAATGKTIQDTEYRKKENEVFTEDHKARLANNATTATANIISAQASMVRAQQLTADAVTAQQKVAATGKAVGAVSAYIGGARQNLSNPEWRGMPSKVFADGEALVNSMPRNTPNEQAAHRAARSTWEEFRKDAKTSEDFRVSRERQTYHNMGMTYVSGAALDTYKKLNAEGRGDEAAEIVAKAATMASLVAAGVPMSAAVNDEEHHKLFHYEQSKTQPWHVTKSKDQNGQEVWTPIMSGDKPIPNMVLNVEQSRLMTAEYIKEFQNRYGILKGSTSKNVPLGDGKSADPLADLGGGGGTTPTKRTTIEGFGEGDISMRLSPNLRSQLEAASTPDDIENLLKAVTDPQADLWALTGEGSEGYGGSEEVGGGGDDNEPPPDTRSEHGAVPASPQFESQAATPSEVPEGGVKPISQESMPPVAPVVGSSTVEPELAKPDPEPELAMLVERDSKSVPEGHRNGPNDFIGHIKQADLHRNKLAKHYSEKDYNINDDGTVTVHSNGIPMSYFKGEFNHAYNIHVGGYSGANSPVLKAADIASGAITKKIRKKIHAVGGERLKVLNEINDPESPFSVPYSRDLIAQAEEGIKQGKDVVNNEKSIKRARQNIEKAAARLQKLTEPLTSLSDLLETSLTLTGSYEGDSGRNIKMTAERARKLGIIK